MEDWMGSKDGESNKSLFNELSDQTDFLSGIHQWYATSHARPTFCNVCREILNGVTSHGFSCEICKYKCHKRCVSKVINNCKWTTLSSIGREIIEDIDGNITMPHQWLEGNLPVSAKCSVCDKTAGSVLRLQDWRCLWCRATVHTQCRPNFSLACPLGQARVSVLPPTALHSVQDEAWEVVRPQASSPLLVFVNSKSGDNQGIRFLRRFKQLLNPAQVFDLIATGPRSGLKLFRHFDPFRILVCSGDGSVGWVLSEIDKLDMHKQCQVAVLPLGTGNDLARVLGWGSSCDDDTHLLQLLEKYEKASTKMLDRWSIMAYERTIAMPKLSLIPGQQDGQLHIQITQYEDSLISHLHNILQSDETSIILNSARRLCETVKIFAKQLSESLITKNDEQLTKKCDILEQKLDLLLQTLTSEQIDPISKELLINDEINNKKLLTDDTDSELSYDKTKLEKCEKDLNNFNFRRHRRTSRFMERERDALLLRANSLKKAIRNLVEYTEQVVDEQNQVNTLNMPTVKISLSDTNLDKSSNNGGDGGSRNNDSLKVLSTSEAVAAAAVGSGSSNEQSPAGSITKLMNLLPLINDDRRRSSTIDPDIISTLPVPPDFADSRRASEVVPPSPIEDKEKLDDNKYINILSSISTDEITIVEPTSSFCPKKDSNGDDLNGHIYHIDSPETDTCPNSDALHGESLMDDISSLLGEVLCDQDSYENTSTDDNNELINQDQRKLIFKHNSIEKHNKNLLLLNIDEDNQFGFENRAFSNILMDKKLDEKKRYCSLAQFVEGNDIARRSFKKCKTTTTTKNNYCNKIDTIENFDDITPTNLKTSKELRNLSTSTLVNIKDDDDDDFKDKDDVCQVSVVIEPPSPILNEDFRINRQLKLGSGDHDDNNDDDNDGDNDGKESYKSKLSISDVTTISNNSSNTNLLAPDNDINFLTKSPAATRRISCCSMLNTAETIALAAKATTTTTTTNKHKDDKEKENRKLPIINPLVKSPAWPHVSTGSGFISKCLLANADTLCAAVSPLIDPDETLMEGFYERCVMNNYFGIGIDAKISLDFHHKREEHPEKCRSRAKNYMWYGVLGSKQWLQKTYKNLEQRVQLECDGERIPLPSLQGIVILNIPSFMGGINFWGGTKEDSIFLPPSFDDKILEVVAVFGSVQMAASRLINLQHHRIAQCQSIQINILGDEGVPIQVDGEAWIQPPGIIRILHKNRMQMLCRNRALENSLKSWEEKQRQSMMAAGGGGPTAAATAAGVGNKQRQSISHEKDNRHRQSIPSQEKSSFLGIHIEKIRQHSFSGPLSMPNPIEKPHHVVTFDPQTTQQQQQQPLPPPSGLLFNDEEQQLLINFIECATTLVKYIKILSIQYKLDGDLYLLANKLDQCLENIHPNGKIIEGPSLRYKFTQLVSIVKQLYEDSCCLLHDRGDKLKLREDLENKLSITLANIEMELKKCIMYETNDGTFIYLQNIHDDQNEHKRKGLFWLKFRMKTTTTTTTIQQSTKSRRDVASWGTQEVATWLETLQLAEYIESFIRNDIHGRELLTLARRDLKDLGVTKVGHVKRILQAIKDLQQGI